MFGCERAETARPSRMSRPGRSGGAAPRPADRGMAERRAAGATAKGGEGTGGASGRAARRARGFWDSSAIVPLGIGEAASDTVRGGLAEDRIITVWWSTAVE